MLRELTNQSTPNDKHGVKRRSTWMHDKYDTVVYRRIGGDEHDPPSPSPRRTDDVSEKPFPISSTRTSFFPPAVQTEGLHRRGAEVRASLDDSGSNDADAGTVALGQSASVGHYLSAVMDVSHSDSIGVADIVQFLDAVQLLPTSDEGRAADREAIVTMLEQLMAHEVAVAGGHSAPSWQRQVESLSRTQCASFLDRCLPSTSIALSERLEMLERASARNARHEELLEAIEQCSSDMDTAEQSLKRYDALMQQCQHVLDQRRMTSQPLSSMVGKKRSQQAESQKMLDETLAALSQIKKDQEATDALVEFRKTEVEEWEARTCEWRHEMRRAEEDMEAANAEEEILLKRLEEVRRRKAQLSDDAVHIAASLAECEASLDQAHVTWQDAISISSSASMQQARLRNDAERAQAAVDAIERGLEVARAEFSRDEGETQAISSRYGLLCAERRKLRNDIIHSTNELAALKTALAALPTPSQQLQQDESRQSKKKGQCISVLIDELHLANERRRRTISAA